MKKLLLIVCALLSMSVLPAEKPAAVPDFAKDWIGSWKLEGKDEFMRIEPTKLSQYSATDGQSFLRAKLQPGKIILKQNGGQIDVTVTLKDKILTLKTEQLTQSFSKVDKVPPELELKPLVLGTTKAVPAAKLKELQTEFATRFEQDQAVRKDPAKRAQAGEVDRGNTSYLKKLIAEYGWIDVTRFGVQTSNHAFMFVQHSGDIPLMLAALPEIEKDVRSGKFGDGQPYALLYDRTMLYTGGKQRYGTQVSGGPNGVLVLALEDKDKVEQRRKELGIFPLAQYLTVFKQQFGAKEVKYEED